MYLARRAADIRAVRPDAPRVGQTPDADPGGTSRRTEDPGSHRIQTNWIEAPSRRADECDFHWENELEDPLRPASGIMAGVGLGSLIWVLLIVNLII